MSGEPGLEPAETGRRRWWRRSTVTTVLVVVALLLLASGLGIGTSKAIASLSGGSDTSTTTSTTPGSTTGNSGSAATGTSLSDGSNSEEAGAPVILQGGGAKPGFGAYNALACRDDNNCLAAGADGSGAGVIGATADGGTTWLNRSLPAGTPALDAVTCGDARHCVAVGQGAILSSIDGGTTWALQPPPVAKTTLVGVTCPGILTCLAVGASVNPNAGPYSGQILASADGGSTWSVDTLPPATMAMGAVTCPTSTRCIAVGGGILTSSDGGQTWQVGTVPGGTGVLRTISCSSATQCVALGPNPRGIEDPSASAYSIVTSDGGATWSSVAMPLATASLGALDCANAGACHAVGPGPFGSTAASFTSGDGGKTWSSSPAPGGLGDIAAMSCPDATTCVSVGHTAGHPAVARTVGGVSSVVELPAVAP